MSRGTLTALLPVLALADHQNRDKVAGILNGRRTAPARGVKENDPKGRLSEIRGRLSRAGFESVLGGFPVGGIVTGGLGRLLDRCRNGMGDKADCRVGTGSNQPINRPGLSQALGDDVLGELTARTCLSREEVLSRLMRDLPHAADDLMSDGSISTEHEPEIGLRGRSSCSGEPKAGSDFSADQE